MDPQVKKSLKQAWQAQIRQVAACHPRFAHAIWKNRQESFARFTHFYQQFANLPRKFRRKFLKRLATTLAGAVLLFALGHTLPARAAVITVDGGVCTLAEALDSANNDNAAGNGCVDGNGVDVIDLQVDVTLSAPLPFITSEITLEGNGHILDGSDAVRVLNVQPTGELTLNNATITGGNAHDSSGGGIANEGILTVNESHVYANSADYIGGGIYNVGTSLVNNSTLAGNFADSGGGLANKGGAAEINNSFFYDNYALEGGGISNGHFGIGGSLTVNNSLVSGNTSFYDGAGIINEFGGTATVKNSALIDNSAGYAGGGISNTSPMTITNSTISGNQASFLFGGGIANSGSIVINNSTITGNDADLGGDGIDNLGELTLNRNIISGNDIYEVYNFEGVINANGFNVVGYSGDARSNDFLPGPNDIIPSGILETVLDMNLTDNGGSTLTHALVSGSMAIDVAPDVDCFVSPLNGLDQRGYVRNVDGDGVPSSNECDAGAFEYASSIAPTVTPTSTPTATSLPDMTSTPRSSPTPTGHPTWTVTPRLSPTPTRTPQSPTQTPDPRTLTRTPTPASLILNQQNSLIVPATAPSPLVRWLNFTILALGNLLGFRKRRI